MTGTQARMSLLSACVELVAAERPGNGSDRHLLMPLNGAGVSRSGVEILAHGGDTPLDLDVMGGEVGDSAAAVSRLGLGLRSLAVLRQQPGSRQCRLVGLVDGWRLIRNAPAALDLAGADLSGAQLHAAGLAGSELAGAVLTGADLSRADLFGVSASRACFAGADLGSSNLGGLTGELIDFRRANLVNADLKGARIIRSTFLNASLEYSFREGAMFPDCFFDTATGIGVDAVHEGGAQQR
jgi:hypothetical protein